MTWKISKKTSEKFEQARESLGFEVEDLRNAFDEKSVRWQDSDKGQEISAWLNELDRILDEIEDIEWEPGE